MLGGRLLISYNNYTSTKQKQISQDLGWSRVVFNKCSLWPLRQSDAFLEAVYPVKGRSVTCSQEQAQQRLKE